MVALALREAKESERLSDLMYETLLETVLSELSLAERMRVSRTPIHDALLQLGKDGLLELRPDRRAVVSTLSSADLRKRLDTNPPKGKQTLQASFHAIRP